MKIILTICCISTLEKVFHHKITANILELRLDSLFFSELFKIEKLKEINLPIILTIRHPMEKRSQCLDCHLFPSKYLTEYQRLNLFLKYIPLVDFIDIEFNSCIRDEVIRLSQQYQKKIIISYHDFNASPDKYTINKMLVQCTKFHGSILKIAATFSNLSTALEFMEYGHALRNQHQVIFIPMQKMGILFRIFGFLYETHFTYVTLTGQANLIGQLSIQDMHQYTHAFKSLSIPKKYSHILHEINQLCYMKKKWDHLYALPQIIPKKLMESIIDS